MVASGTNLAQHTICKQEPRIEDTVRVLKLIFVRAEDESSYFLLYPALYPPRINFEAKRENVRQN